jgi:hypothetical protein
MCGRYALGIRAAFVRHQFAQHNMLVDEMEDEDEARETFNFAPGYYGLVYRADFADGRARAASLNDDMQWEGGHVEDNSQSTPSQADEKEHDSHPGIKYKIQSMKWGMKDRYPC